MRGSLLITSQPLLLYENRGYSRKVRFKTTHLRLRFSASNCVLDLLLEDSPPGLRPDQELAKATYLYNTALEQNNLFHKRPSPD